MTSFSDDTAIKTLQNVQKSSKDISEFREFFSVVSDRAVLLHFCASDFRVVDPKYQFSLKWFISIIKNAVYTALAVLPERDVLAVCTPQVPLLVSDGDTHSPLREEDHNKRTFIHALAGTIMLVSSTWVKTMAIRTKKIIKMIVMTITTMTMNYRLMSRWLSSSSLSMKEEAVHVNSILSSPAFSHAE